MDPDIGMTCPGRKKNSDLKIRNGLTLFLFLYRLLISFALDRADTDFRVGFPIRGLKDLLPQSEAIMIVEGIKLSIVGILFVYTFLLVLVGMMHLISRILKPYTEQEAREQAIYKRKSSANALMKDNRLIAVISAAVSAHRKRMQR